MRAAKLAEGPGTDIAMQVDSDSSLVLDYDFKNVSSDGKTVYDTSGNGYNGTLGNGAEISEDGYLSFDGTALTTPLKTLSYPYTVAFDLKVDSEEAAKIQPHLPCFQVMMDRFRLQEQRAVIYQPM